MTWVLKIQDGDGFREIALLSKSQPIIIGRGAAADVCVAEDLQMSSRHVSVSVADQGCHFQDLQSTNGSFLNDKLCESADLKPGDLLRCGNTLFCIEDSDQDRPRDATNARSPAKGQTEKTHVVGGSSPDADPIPPELKPRAGFLSDSAVELCERFNLNKILGTKADQEETTTDFARRLLNSEEVNDSLNFLAFALPKRSAVWWAVKCIRAEESFKADDDPELLDLVEQWVRNPSEKLRRAAMAFAEKLEMGTPASWAAVGAFWAHGSMAPIDAPVVPAKDEMTGRAIAGAVILASVVHTPENAGARRKAFTELALQIVGSERPWD